MIQRLIQRVERIALKNDGDDGRREVEVEEVEQGRRGLRVDSY